MGAEAACSLWVLNSLGLEMKARVKLGLFLLCAQGVVWGFLRRLRGYAKFFGCPGAQINVFAALAAKRA